MAVSRFRESILAVGDWRADQRVPSAQQCKSRQGRVQTVRPWLQHRESRTIAYAEAGGTLPSTVNCRRVSSLLALQLDLWYDVRLKDTLQAVDAE